MATSEYSGVLKQVDDSGNVVSLYPNTKKVETTIATSEDLMLNTAEGFVVDALVVKDVNSKINGIEFQIVDGKLQYRYDQEVWNNG